LAQRTALQFSAVQFGNTTTGTTDSADIVFTSLNNQPVKVKDVNLVGSGFTFKGDTAFDLSSGNQSIRIYFSPRHNILHQAQLIVVTEGWSGGYLSLTDYRVAILGTGVYNDTYYSSTQNLSEEALKQALTTKLTQGYTSLGYNTARDKMFMELDNWKMNGRGAATNSTQCVYTGRMVTGYASRTAAQNSPNNLNTEHTWPQSMFNSAEPMLSDIHHLFVTDNSANSERGNNPFAMVSSPSWSVGGSKSNGSLFEPRDEQKGRTARAMLYFVVRYGNQGNFLTAQQEIVLRQWALQFAPDSIDRRRNNEVFALQKNRNPFVDHPEFLERITSLSTTSIPVSKRSVEIHRSSFVFSRDGSTGSMDTIVCELAISATGNTAISISNVKLTSGKFQVDTFPATISAGQTSFIRLRYIRQFFSGILIDTLIFSTNDPFKPQVSIPLYVRYYPESASELKQEKPVLYPNPLQHTLYVSMPGITGIRQITLFNTIGQQFTFMGNNEPMVGLNLAHLASGCYFVKVTLQNGSSYSDKINIVR
jgi:endonuclease I